MFLWSADDTSSGRGTDDMSSGRGADNIFFMIEYIKTTRDDVWMTLVLSVRKEDIKDHFRQCAHNTYMPR